MLFYLQLVVCTAGSVIYLFLLTLFAGLRRRRPFETTLFLTGLSTFLVYAGLLLDVNVGIHYASPPRAAYLFAAWVTAVGALFLPPLMVHTHIEYLRRIYEGRTHRAFYLLAALFYLPVLPFLGAGIKHGPRMGAWAAGIAEWGIASWFALAFLLSAVLQLLFAERTANQTLRKLHIWLAGFLVLVVASELVPGVPPVVPLLLFLCPGLFLGYYVLHNRFLPLGVQRNLVFTVSAAFLALLYLTLVRRLSDWLEPYFPPVATTSILLFVLVIFFEPLQRRVGQVLQRAFRREAEQLQRLTSDIQQAARGGNLEQLVRFAEARILESFALAGVRLVVRDAPPRSPALPGRTQSFPVRSGADELGVLEVAYLGESLSGETSAALDYLAGQLPAALDLCRLLEEKLNLERQLAERERLALLGQMAASISHNLRNPLSSMKTLLQVQLENPELPESLQNDCRMVVSEVDRLSAKLTQLLKYAKPAVRPAATPVDLAAVTEQVVSLLRHDAERRNVSLELDRPAGKESVAGSEESLSDVLSNLIVNAIEAAQPGGTVRVGLERRDGRLGLEVSDTGPGIPAEVRERIFQPFFSTKPSGTGLGLAIVQRRLAELGATVECESPVREGRGTRFTVTLPPST